MRASIVAAVVGLALMVMTGSAAAQDPDEFPGEAYHVEFVTTWWQPSPELTIQTGALTAVGITDFDFAEEFGIDNERFTEFRLVFKPAQKHKIRFAYVPMRYDQTAILTRPVVFNDRSYVGTANVNIKWDLWRFGYEWDFMTRERAYVGLIGELKYNDVRATVRSLGRSDTAESRAPAPTVGVIARGYLHRNVSVSGELTGGKIPGGDSLDATFFDFDISATASLSRHFGVQGGYRAVTADYLVDEDNGDLKMMGVYVGLVSRF